MLYVFIRKIAYFFPPCIGICHTQNNLIENSWEAINAKLQVQKYHDNLTQKILLLLLFSVFFLYVPF